MKRILLAAALLTIGANVNAQETRTNGGANAEILSGRRTLSTQHQINGTANKGTGLTNPFTLATDSMYAGVSRSVWADYAAPLDSGYIWGTNVSGSNGYAYLYDVDFDATNDNDTSVTVLGFLSKWAGRIQPTSTKTVTFSVWSRGTDKTLIPGGYTRTYIYGKPATLLASETVKDTTLKTDGSFTITQLSTPLSNQTSSIYVGYTTSYTWSALAADTFGLRSTGTSTGATGATQPNYFNMSGSDTLVNVNNMVKTIANVWVSPTFQLNVGGLGDMIIAPIVSLSCPTCAPTSVKGFSRNNLTFFGNYPNPANNNTNIRFAIKNKADITVEVVDGAGKSVSIVNQPALTAGEHIINIPTANFAAGNYIYVVRTSEGDAVASQFTVIK